MNKNIYTGREIAIFTDVHAMYEPLIRVLKDIRKRGIGEIYSLGDNTTLGPNPREVLDLLNEYNVIQIMGNSEYYLTLGSAPFSYFNSEREMGLDWVSDRVSDYISELKKLKPSMDLVIGNRKVALCHFASDVRWDYIENSTWSYQSNFGKSDSAKQFLYTNSYEYFNKIDVMLDKYGIYNAISRGYLSSKINPLFDGKMVTWYDDVFEGHVHFPYEDRLDMTNIHTLRALALGETNTNLKDRASYIILKEKILGGFDIERVFILFDRERLLDNIYNSSMPSKKRVLTYLK